MLLGRKAIGGAAAGLSLLTAGGVVVLLGPDSATGTTATETDAARSSTTAQTLTDRPSASVHGVTDETATSVPSATALPFATAALTPGPAAPTSSTRVRSAADRAAARRLTSQRISVSPQRTTTTSDRGGVTTKPTTSTTSPATTRTTTRTTSSPTASSRTTSSSNGGSSASYESTLLALVNAERTSRGLPALIAARCPDTFAESWAARLVESGAFEHQSLSPIMSSCGATRAAENIARGNISAAAMVKLWMNSPGHRDNILDPKLTQVGTAAVRDSSGTWTAVQDFIRP